jgi:WD40 repeat protein
LVASADDNSKVNVYKWPNPEDGASAVVCIGHSSHVTKVRWSLGDTHLFTLGGNDTTTMQWKVSLKQ